MTKLFNKLPIVCIGFPKWDGNYAKSTILLMQNLANYHQILYIDYQHTWKDVLTGIFTNSEIPILKIFGLKNQLIKVKDNNEHHIWLLTPPPIFPINWIRHKLIYSFFLKINSFIILRSVLKAMKRLNIAHPIVINAFNPFMGLYNLKKFKEHAHFYYCYDEISQAKWMKIHGPTIENKFAKQVDGIIVSSQELYNKLSQLNKNCSIIHNGVDFNLFNKNVRPYFQSNIKTIGYTGTIDDRLDYDLIISLLKKFSEIDFVFVGRSTTDKIVKALRKYPNFRYLPPINYNQLPDILKDFDLCLIPFLRNKFTQNIYPLKINEYLAAGKIVLKTNFAKLPEFNEIVYTCGNIKEAINIINQLNSEDKDLENIKTRIRSGINLAKQNSWESRAHLFSSIICSNINSIVDHT